ncbi:sugar dehydrogenase complex small subunit [Achromobacter aloeverae]
MTHPTRRDFLKFTSIGLISAATGELLPVRFGHAAEPAADAAQLKRFIGVSGQLTQRDTLDPALAQALLHAFVQTNKFFDAQLAALADLLAQQPALLNGDKLKFPDDQAAQQKLAQAVLSGWYTGVVGSGKDALYVTYVNSLSNRLVADVLVPPSYSYGPCGSWQSKP